MPASTARSRMAADSSGAVAWPKFMAPSANGDISTLVDLPVRIERRAFLPTHAQLDDGPPADTALPPGHDAGDATGGDLPGAEVEVLGGVRELSLADDLVEVDADRIRNHRDCLTEDG